MPEEVDPIKLKPKQTQYFFAGKDDLSYEKEDCPTRIVIGAMSGAMIGTFWGMATGAWYPTDYIERLSKERAKEVNRMMASYWRPLAGPVFWMTTAGATYKGAQCLSEYVFDKDRSRPWWNTAAGGAASGMVIGAMTRRFDYGAIASLTLGVTFFLSGLSDAYRTDQRATPHILFKDEYKTEVTDKSLQEKYPEFKDL